MTQVAQETIHLTNNESSPIAFRVKTTSPKHYCVRPNSGIVQKGERKEISGLFYFILFFFKKKFQGFEFNNSHKIIVLLHTKEREKLDFDYRTREKFLIQWMPVSEGLDQDQLASSVIIFSLFPFLFSQQNKIKK